MTGDTAVLVWWASLSLIAVLNLAAWGWLFTRWLQAPVQDAKLRAAQRVQFWLAFAFTAGCAFRSFLPRAEAQRIVLYDAWISNAFLGRTVATVAELAFILQWALLLNRVIPPTARVRWFVAWLPVVLIALAEVFSWYTALTTDFIGSVIEESLWLVSSAICIAGFIWLLPFYTGRVRRWLRLAILVGTGYCLFLALVDVPMYRARWAADEARGHVALSLAHGLKDSLERRVLTRALHDWRDEIPWMTLYFSVGVWMSLGMTQIAGERALRR